MTSANMFEYALNRQGFVMKRILFSIVVIMLSILCINQTTLGANSSHNAACRCQINQACWPKTDEWNKLEKELQGHLIKPVLPLSPCLTNTTSTACHTAIKNIHNPYFNESDPGATQSQGWMDAWKNHPSQYAVEVETTNDVAAAVKFARKHQLKLVIKGTGHDYLGRSNAPQSLLIWTHKMRNVKFDPSFTPQGCSATRKPVPAVTVEAGVRWLEAYGEVTTNQHRYVQGGGCATVGAAGGFTQGGGFGSFSKMFGTGAAGILQAEIVTANGDILIANECQNKDLFWAIRGGGAGTFGVITKMTLKTHDLPENFGSLQAHPIHQMLPRIM